MRPHFHYSQHNHILCTNLYPFFNNTCPCFHKSDITLQDVWKFYDQPYGHSIPIELKPNQNNNSDTQIECVYFVPHLSGIQLFKQDELIFELFESAKPDQRMPLIDKIETLIQDEQVKQVLWDLNVSELDWRRSWFCIAWYPILCHSYTLNHLRGGQILTLHSFELLRTFLHPRFLKSNFYSKTAFYLPIQGCLPYKVKEETWFESVTPHHLYSYPQQTYRKNLEDSLSIVNKEQSESETTKWNGSEQHSKEKRLHNTNSNRISMIKSTTSTAISKSHHNSRNNQLFLLKGFQIWIQNHQLLYHFCDYEYIHSQQYYLFK